MTETVDSKTTPPIDGFFEAPKRRADGTPYPGRLQLTDVSITSNPGEIVATVIVTAGELADWAEGSMLFTDQQIQRGVKPEAPAGTSIVLNLRDGYPDTKYYIFNEANADDMVSKILDGTARHLNPLVWNLRPGTFEAYHDRNNRSLSIYAGRIFLPDSHHRHQAIIKATRLKRQAAKGEYPDFDENRQFKVELYFMAPTEEGDYFYDKNQRSSPVAKSKAYDLTTQDALAILAKRVIDLTPSLAGNVNRVTDKLTEKNSQVMTLSTLRGFLEAGLGVREHFSEDEIEKLAEMVSDFYELLAAQRPELGLMSLSDRKIIRSQSLADAAVMIHGYGSLLRKYLNELEDVDQRKISWAKKLAGLRDENDYSIGDWTGDFLSKANPLWKQLGVIQATKSGGETLSNTRQSRTVCSQELQNRLGI